MKTLLIFPSQWYPTQPYLSTPYLTAYLRSKGWDVAQRDFNIESYDSFLSEPVLTGIAGKIDAKLEAIRSKKTFSIKDKSLMDVLATGQKFSGAIISQIEDAKAVMRTPERFFDFESYRQADLIIKSALKLVSDVYAPAVFNLSTFESGIRAEESTRKAAAASRDPLTNPFIELYDQTLLPTESWEDYAVVGISIVGISQIIPGLTLARMLKERYPHLHVTLGGPIFSVNATQLLGHPEFFDEFCHSIVTFEGEEPLNQLLNCLKKDIPLGAAPNLIFVEDGEVKINKERVEMRFEEVPHPTFDGLPMEKYLSPYPIIPVLQSRGCYWGKCTFCTHSYVYGHRYGKQRTDQMVDELEAHSKEFNTKYFTFSDEAVSPHSLNDVSDALLERGVEIKSLALLKFEKVMDDELFRKIHDAGFIFLMYGMESANDRVLALIDKGTTKAVERDVLMRSHKAGIWNHAFLFFGFPTETRPEAQETIDFLMGNLESIHSFGPGVFLLNRDSSCYQFPDKYSIKKIIQDPDADIAMNLDFLTDVGMSRAEAVEMNDKCIKLAEENFSSLRLWGTLPREHFLLYLDHFGKDALSGQGPKKTKDPKAFCEA
ncbi:MAG: radical SAM protein [Candidatus Nitrohelix vancouverensis]|uniref:Radical SAM protein n=1 Tax=Candidatus Nitrohelix vancouverensis TaxID=2705534 RepID=A0A7T0C0C9_9BACT|nr:MAG: radical SAM protein [Candidatus Nitrohelix vancouverensis]